MLKKILLLAAALVALAAAPAAAQYSEVLSGEVSNTSPAPGEAITVSGTCTEADVVDVAIEGVGPLGEIPVAADDTYSGSVTIPSDLDPGTYELLITCGTEVLSLTITVGGTADGGGTGPLARTGSDGTGTLLRVGGGLLLVGAVVALVATKRRTASA